jgi:hypothetical protein
MKAGYLVEILQELPLDLEVVVVDQNEDYAVVNAYRGGEQPRIVLQVKKVEQ